MGKKEFYIAPQMTTSSFKWENALLQTSFNGGHKAGKEEEPPEEWNGGHDDNGGGAGSGWVAPDDGD